MNKEAIEKMIDKEFCYKGYSSSGLPFLQEKEIYLSDVKQFIFETIIPEVIKSIIDNKSLLDNSNGRFNREIELREKIKELYNITL